MLITGSTIAEKKTFFKSPFRTMKTPQQTYPALAEALGIPEIYLKREDLHPYGSHKGRSIPLMMKLHIKEGKQHFAISSSGNAALAAILAAQNHNRNNPANKVTLDVYIGKHIDEKKKKILLDAIDDTAITLHQVERPKQTVFQKEKEGVITSLRQSTDDTALQGYHELAREIDKIPDLAAIFIPTSSGTTAQGIAEAFDELNNRPQIHIVQTTACHPIAKEFDTYFSASESSIAGAIVDAIAHRKQALIQKIHQTHGFGWIISDEEITDTQELIKKHTGLSLSTNSALSVAGLRKAVGQGRSFSGPVVCMVGGK